MASQEDYLRYEDAKRAFHANINYRINDSISECRLLLAAIDALVQIECQDAQFGGSAGERVRLQYERYASIRDRAEKWLSTKRIADDPQIGYVNTEDYIC